MNEAPIAASPLDVGVIHHDSLWMRCFWVIARQNSAEGREVIKFCDVDDLVLGIAKMSPTEFQAWMMDNGNVSGAL